MVSQQNSSAQSAQPQSFQQQNSQQPFQQQAQQPFQQQSQQQFGSLGPMPDFTQSPQPQQMFGQSNNQPSFNFGSDLPPLSAPDPFPSLNDTQPKKKGLFDKLLGK